MNLLCICDSPTRDTGFGRVASNLISRLPDDYKIFVWGIGYDGLPHGYKCHIAPANINSQWKDKENLKRMEQFINCIPGPLTILTLNDAFRLNELIPIFERCRKLKPIKLVAYTPIDGPLIEVETKYLKYADIIIAYTEYGKREIAKFSEKPIYIIPHGNDNRFYEKKINRQRMFSAVHPEDFLIINVNTNSPRKAPYKSLEIFKHLSEKDDSIKLYMHMPPVGLGGLNLRNVAEQLGIDKEKLFLADPLFDGERSLCPTEFLNDIYNAADLVLSTSLGEGWGLTATEAAMTKTPIAVPRHTSYNELFNSETAIMLPCDDKIILANDQSRYRPLVNSAKSAKIILEAINSGSLFDRKEKNFININQYNWNDITDKWTKIFSLVQHKDVALHG